MSRVLRFFSRFLFFFDRSSGGGTTTALMDPAVEPGPPEVALTEMPVPVYPAVAPPERIRERDRLRQLLRNNGVSPLQIETIPGQCPTQVEMQIRDCSAELSRLGIAF